MFKISQQQIDSIINYLISKNTGVLDLNEFKNMFSKLEPVEEKKVEVK